jgi:hypothetical protein
MFYKITFFLLFFLPDSSKVSAQLFHENTRDLSMGNSTVAFPSQHNFSKNIAVVPSENLLVGIEAINYYFIKNLSPVYISIQKSINEKTSLLLTVGRIGTEAFNEKLVETGISKKLGTKFSAGIKLQLHQRNFQDANYDVEYYFLPEAGFYSSPINNLGIGVIIRNPLRLRMNKNDPFSQPAMLNTGLSYKTSDKLLMAFSFEQKTNRPLSYHAGIEYLLYPVFAIRVGWHTAPVTQSFGVMLGLKGFTIDLGIQSMTITGNSTALSITFKL